MHSHGFTINAPPSWDVRVYRRAAIVGEQTYPVVHAGNFALPLRRGDYGSGAVELMGPSNVLVVLFEHDAEAANTALFQRRGMPSARVEDFSPRALQRTLRGQSGVQYFFHEASRAFCLYIVLGSHARRRRLVPAANELVRSVAIR
ncbi:MAG: hypothetical protein QOI25_1492 [Mycobacterium sp.]|nr:hypothetical protein [Mycobacterium sp.]